jgi:pyridoxal 5'-phosphate synthase pdxS subunit
LSNSHLNDHSLATCFYNRNNVKYFSDCTEMEENVMAETVAEKGTWTVKKGLAEMLKGGVIMDVTTPEQAKIAEEAGACAVMALERVPADIRAAGGVARMADPSIILRIMDAVTIPVMAKARIGHFVEAQILEALGVDYIDESEVLTPADEQHHIDKHAFKVPFVCGARNLGEALRRIAEGAAMIRTKGEPGTGNVVEAVRHMRMVMGEIRRVQNMPTTAQHSKRFGVCATMPAQRTAK